LAVLLLVAAHALIRAHRPAGTDRTAERALVT
jgi:hypothetical protein